MLTLNRRRIMLTAMMAPPALILGQGALPAFAQDAAAPAGNAGTYRFQVGEIAATVVSDGVITGPPTVYAGDAPEQELAEVLRRAFLPTDLMTLNLNTVLLEIGGQRVLLEAGAGQTMGEGGGRLFRHLEAAGLTAADIDIVVISHTHPDHVGNLRGPDGGRAFPNATVMAPQPDWAFFVENDPDLSYMPVPADFQQRFAANIQTSVAPYAEDIVLYTPGDELLPGLTTVPAPGHTPGMAALLVHSGSDQLLLTADLAYHPVVNVNRPWRPGPDRDQETAAASRQRIFDRAAAERMLVLGFHYPFPGLGHILRTDGGYAWVPAGWQF